MIVTIPKYGVYLKKRAVKIEHKNLKYPLTLPTKSSSLSHLCPRLYRPRSWTSLLSPFVKTFNLPVPCLQTPFRLRIKKQAYSSWTLRTRWTIGMSRPLMLNTTISPATMGSRRYIVKYSISPLSKAGDILSLHSKFCDQVDRWFILYLRTTTMGLSLLASTPRPFQIM